MPEFNPKRVSDFSDSTTSEELLAKRTDLETELLSAPVQTDLRKLSKDTAFKRQIDIASDLGAISEILSFRGVIDEDGNFIQRAPEIRDDQLARSSLKPPQQKQSRGMGRGR